MFKKIYVEITNICNKNCSFCSRDNRERNEMTLEQFEYILKQIKPYTNYIYLHVKGEPLLHSQFPKIIKLCEQYKFNVNITTNGTLLFKQREILTSNCIRQINISLHSFDKNDIKNYLNNIFLTTKYLLNKNKKLNIVYRFWAIRDNHLSDDNKEIVEQIINYFDLKKDFINQVIEKNNIKIIDRLYLNKDIMFEWPSLDSKYKNDIGTCYGTRTHIGVLSNGDVIPCCLDSSDNIKLGNIFEKDIYDIINSQRFVNMKQNFQNNKVIEELCKHCSYRKRFDENKK